MRWLNLIAILMLLPGCADLGRSSNIPDELNGPISLTLNTDGQFANGWPWTLNVDDDGAASLRIDSFPTPVSRSFNVTQTQVEQLRSLLITERFFELDDDYGETVVDGSVRTISIRCGAQSRTVRIRFLMNWVHGNTSRLHEPARAVRVWRCIRQWFDDAEAVDLARYDEMVLKASPP